MGKSRAGRCTSAFDRNRLLRRLQACKLSDCSIDEIVDGLRSRFPDYRRYPIQPFKNQVHKTLDFHRQRDGNEKEFRELSNEPAVATPSTSPHRKKLKKNDGEKEERLLHRESEYLRLRTKQKDLPSPSSSSSAASSSSESDDEEEESEAVSTSEDVIFDEKFEPEFDLMKSMLRSSYGNSASKNAGSKVEEKNLELEVVNNPRKIDLVQENGRGGSERKRISENLNSNGGKDMKKSGDDSEGKRVDGPRFRDLGGMRGVLDELMMEVIVPLYHPQVPQWLGVKPMAGILLHGPPGCGKTKLAHAIANETGVPFYRISATEVVSGVSGASEENIRDLFSKASRTSPSIIFIDEIDAIASKRESLQREMERRIVTQLMTCMDESHHIIGSNEADSNIGSTDQKNGYVLVIGATNRPDALDPALRRRFDREIYLSIPDENARKEILSVLTRNLRLEGAFDLHKIAKSTPGFVGADLATLANKAGNLAMKRIIERRKCEFSREPNEEWWKHPWIPEDMEELSINMGDFEEAIKIVQPSARREGFSSIPNVKWEDVGGLDSLRKEFDRYIVARIKSPEDYEEFGVDLETGFLLYGPPGCGKTLIAKAVANEAGANFIHIKGPELLNKYVGESELAVRTIFSRARMCSPCVLFFDEVDALATKRGTEGGWVVERLLNQLLIELDGADQRKGVFVIGATNRPEVMDRAVLRPGRFGKLLYVPLPGPNERGLILKALARKKPVSPDVDLMAIGQNEACENLSGADLAAVINEAAMAALEEKQLLGEGSFTMKMWTINGSHFQRALEKVSPSVSEKQNNYYKVLSQSFRAA